MFPRWGKVVLNVYDVQVCSWRGTRPPQWWDRRGRRDSCPSLSWRGIFKSPLYSHRLQEGTHKHTHISDQTACTVESPDVLILLLGDLLRQTFDYTRLKAVPSGITWLTPTSLWSTLSLSPSTQPERSVWAQPGLRAHDGHWGNHRCLHGLLRTNPLLEAKLRQLMAHRLSFYYHCY